MTYLPHLIDDPAFAAIDLGSNALRAIIVRLQGDKIEVLKEVREPLRLGEDVFSKGIISPEKCRQTEECFIRLLHLFTAYGVDDVRAIATSAMRDARNSQALIHNISLYTGIDIGAISGREEAQLIFNAVSSEISLKNKRAILMDIGGGSTEISIVIDGKLTASHSFNIGTVRLLRHESQKELDIRISLMVEKILRFIHGHFGKKTPDLFIGTGGNLRRMGKIRRKILNKSSEECLYSEIAHMADTLFSMSFIDRVRKLELDRNRADVILPATMLVRILMKGIGAKKILLPKVGLKEGIILSMLDKEPRKFKRLPKT
jgi:exopolyphosphatase/guanosine-5'-triphosphate,3'-diphosphate pyrophosphatase